MHDSSGVISRDYDRLEVRSFSFFFSLSYCFFLLYYDSLGEPIDLNFSQ